MGDDLDDGTLLADLSLHLIVHDFEDFGDVLCQLLALLGQCWIVFFKDCVLISIRRVCGSGGQLERVSLEVEWQSGEFFVELLLLGLEFARSLDQSV